MEAGGHSALVISDAAGIWTAQQVVDELRRLEHNLLGNRKFLDPFDCNTRHDKRQMLQKPLWQLTALNLDEIFAAESATCVVQADRKHCIIEFMLAANKIENLHARSSGNMVEYEAVFDFWYQQNLFRAQIFAPSRWARIPWRITMP